MSSNEGLQNTEYEEDREIQEFELRPSTFDLTEHNGQIDIISWFFTHKRSLVCALIVSNFQFATFEIKYGVLNLLEELGIGDDEKIMQLENDSVINSQPLREATEAGLFRKTEGIATFFSNQRHENIPVYSLVSEDVFKASLISAFLLNKFSEILTLPQRTDESLDSLFRTELQLLFLLDKEHPQPLTILETNFLGEKKRPVTKTTLLDLAQNLLFAGFIERIGSLITINKAEYSNSSDRSVFKKYIERLLESREYINISYEELRGYLIKEYLNDPITRAEQDAVVQNVSKYLNRLKEESRITVNDVRQKYDDEDKGSFGVAREYVLTQEGELFLDLVKNLLEDPEKLLGRGSDFYIHDSTSLKAFNDFSSGYKILISHILKLLFE